LPGRYEARSAPGWRLRVAPCGALLFLLQFHQDSPYTSHVPGDGCWRGGSAAERGGFGSPLGSLRTAEGGESSINHERVAPTYFHWKCGFAVWNIEHASQCRCCNACPAKTVDYASRCLLGCLGCGSFYHFDAQVRPKLGLRFGRNGRRLLAEIKVGHYPTSFTEESVPGNVNTRRLRAELARGRYGATAVGVAGIWRAKRTRMQTESGTPRRSPDGARRYRATAWAS
jgi:hypothetical protein